MNSETPKETESNAKSCKGWLFYTLPSSKSTNPTSTCVGISRILHEIPCEAVRKAELDLSKRGTKYENFNHVCFGHSIYFDNKDSKQVPKLPICSGLELLMSTEKPSQSPVDHVDHIPVPVPNKTQELQHTTPQPQHDRGDEFINRFKRNACVVASGVDKNLKRVGDYVKKTIHGILNPPK